MIDRFLPLIHRLLSPRGVCYMILVQENDPDEISRRLAQESHGAMYTECVLRKGAVNEMLQVMKIFRP